MFGELAQMVERLLSMQEVLGSIPRFSSFFSDIVFDDSVARDFCTLSDKVVFCFRYTVSVGWSINSV